MDATGLTQLLSPQGWALLQQLPPYREADALRLASGLRDRGVAPELVAAAMTQSRLRARAQEKFGDFAATMLFTAAGLEQATRLTVAVYHAKRYAHAGCRLVADLGCGIGGDTGNRSREGEALFRARNGSFGVCRKGARRTGAGSDLPGIDGSETTAGHQALSLSAACAFPSAFSLRRHEAISNRLKPA